MIRFVYFDVGGVVIKDFSGTNKWEELQKNLGIPPEKSGEFKVFFDEHEPEFCLGKDLETMVPLLKEKFSLKLPDDYSFLKDFVDRFEKNESIWPVIEKTKRKYKIGLLTNMYTNMLNMIREKGLLPAIEWDRIVDSSIEKVMKPDAAVFKLAEMKSGFKGKEILFIDNGRKHVDAAANFGWHSILYNPTDTESSNNNIRDVLKI